MNITKRIIVKLAGATALAGLLAGPAAAWEPVKPVDFVIMAGAGGGADQIARFMQAVATKHKMMNRPLVPNNRGGGSGAEALIALNSAKDPDHTILVTLNSFFTTPLRQPNLAIDILDATPGAMMAVDPFILWVHKDSGITTFDEWLEEARKGEYVMGGTGKGQEDSLVITYLQQAFDLDIKYIPYKGGGDVAKDLAGKQVMATVNNPSETRGFYANGDVVPILAFSDERLDAFPDVPTLKEAGVDFSYYNQRAVVGAPGQSDEAAAYYQDLFEKIFNTEEWKEYMETESLTALWLTPEEQKEYWVAQLERHKELLAAMGE